MKKLRKILLSSLLALALLLTVLPASVLAYTLYASNSTGGDSRAGVSSHASEGGGNWYAQTFTPVTSRKLNRIDLYLWKFTGYDPGDVTVSIRATSGGEPTGSDLDASAEFDGSTLTASTADFPDVAWTSFAMSGNLTLTAGVQYAIVVRASNGTAGYNSLEWGYASSGVHSGGQLWQGNGWGTSWSGGSPFSGYDLYFREYGTADVPLATIVTGGAYSTVVNGTLTATFAANLTDNASCTTIRGFEIGTSTGNYLENLKLDQLAIGGNYTDDELLSLFGYVWRGEEGEFQITSSSLSANTTYYYRAFAITIDAQGNYGYAYGEEKTHKTVPYSGQLVPVVDLSGFGITYSKLLASVNVLSSPSATLASVGFEWGTNWSGSPSTDNITWFGSSSEISNRLGIHLFSPEYDPNGNIREGWYVFGRGFATDVLGNKGYSTIKSVIKPFKSISPSGVTVTNTGSFVKDNTALVTASITNPSNVPITAYICSWGETSSASDQLVQIQLESTPSTLAHTITDLKDTTIYHFKFGVYTENMWVWSQPTVFTTGYAAPYPIGGVPSVATKAATNIGANNFRANGELTALGDADVTELGFAWSLTNVDNFDAWNFSLVSGNFSVGLFNQTLTFSQSNKRVYFTAVARNLYGRSYGSVYYVNMGSDNGTGGTGTVPNPTQWLLNWLNKYGLNNPVGKWGIVIILMIIMYLIFHESKILRIALPCLAFGLGLVSGFLEWWIILLLAIVATAVGLWFASKTQGG